MGARKKKNTFTDFKKSFGRNTKTLQNSLVPYTNTYLNIRYFFFRRKTDDGVHVMFIRSDHTED